MFGPLAGAIDIILKLFALGLFVTVILNWVNARDLKEVKSALNRFYDIFLDPLRRVIKPIPVPWPNSGPVRVDFTPLLLLLIVVICHRILMWIF